MIRADKLTWVCDGCGREVVVEGGDFTRPPDGWVPVYYGHVRSMPVAVYCPDCSLPYRATGMPPWMYDDFMRRKAGIEGGE